MKDQNQEGAHTSEATSQQAPVAQPAAPASAPAGQPGQAGGHKPPFNPLAGAADVKSTRPVVVTTSELEQIIPEPAYDIPPISAEPNPLDQNSGGQQQQSQSSGAPPYPPRGGEGAYKPSPPYDQPPGGGTGYTPDGPAKRPEGPKKPIVLPMENLTPEERNVAAENFAKMAMTGYKTLHKAANAALKVSEFKQSRLARKGELDLATPVVPTRSGGKVSIGEFLTEYNNDCKDTFVVDPEWEEEVMPVLTRVLAKHGIGLTDEQHLMALVGQDLGYKTVGMFIPLMRQRSIMMDSFKDLTKAIKEGAEIVAPAVRHAPAAPPPPPPPDYGYEAPPPRQQPVYDNSVQRDAIDEYVMSQERGGDIPMAGAVQPHIQRKWGNKDLLRKASNISKRLQKDKPQPASKARSRKR